MKVSIIQMNSQSDKKTNLAQAKDLIIAAVKKDSPDLICLPETFTHRGGSLTDKIAAAEELPTPGNNGAEAYSLLQTLAKRHQITIHGGSLSERDADRFYNTSIVFNSEGHEIARYRKMHLFKAKISDGTIYNEANFYSPGNSHSIYEINRTKVGCTICYDLRFSELFQLYCNSNVKVIMVPASFNDVTGRAHWEILCRARAIETQSYLVAAAQVGEYQEVDGIKRSWGHSMIIDPWGNIIAKLDNYIGFVTAEIDTNLVDQIRFNMPMRE